MNRRVFLSLASSVFAQQQKPNFLFLFADDLGWGDVGFNGRKDWSTPNLDRIAAQGTIFDRWYTAFPVCAPSRACLMTGRYGIHHTVRNNSVDIPAGEVTIAETLKGQGYATALFGKWHQGARNQTHPLDQGFDETFGYLTAQHAWEHFPKKFWRGRVEEEVSGYSCDIIVKEAMRFLDQNRAKPFFLYLPFIEPHFYIEAPEENLKKYRGKFPEKEPSKPYRANYAAMIERLDAAIGRVVAHLDKLGLRESTCIVFTSDNGATFEAGNQGVSAFHDSNRPFRGQKRTLEEGGIRMPSFVRWPGKVPAGKRSKEVVHMIDVHPTFAALAGTKAPANVDGADMSAVWQGRSKSPERTVFWEWPENPRQLAAMRGDYKLLDINDARYLYNVDADPGERRNLAPEMPELAKRLAADIDAWLKTAATP
ncbi:MAG: sulfatase [Acidobacteria bacterium]|nr:sulfatase [Acidobacteriota bacterium]